MSNYSCRHASAACPLQVVQVYHFPWVQLWTEPSRLILFSSTTWSSANGSTGDKYVLPVRDDHLAHFWLFHLRIRMRKMLHMLYSINVQPLAHVIDLCPAKRLGRRYLQPPRLHVASQQLPTPFNQARLIGTARLLVHCRF